MWIFLASNGEYRSGTRRMGNVCMGVLQNCKWCLCHKCKWELLRRTYKLWTEIDHRWVFLGKIIIIYVQRIGIRLNNRGRGGKMGENDSVEFKWRVIFKRLGLKLGYEELGVKISLYIGLCVERLCQKPAWGWLRSEGIWKRETTFLI